MISEIIRLVSRKKVIGSQSRSCDRASAMLGMISTSSAMAPSTVVSIAGQKPAKNAAMTIAPNSVMKGTPVR